MDGKSNAQDCTKKIRFPGLHHAAQAEVGASPGLGAGHAKSVLAETLDPLD